MTQTPIAGEEIRYFLEYIIPRATPLENGVWFEESKAWMVEAGGWQHDQNLALQKARADVRRFEMLVRNTDRHVDAIAAHLGALKMVAAGTTRAEEQAAHQDEQARHMAFKQISLELMGQSA